MPRFPTGRILAAFLIVLASARGTTAGDNDWKTQRDLGRKALQAGDLDTAEERMKQAIVEVKKLGADHDAELVEGFACLSDVYLAQERMTEANVLLEQSLLLVAQTPGANVEVLERVYVNLAAVRMFQKNLPEAESLLKRALALREKRLGAGDPRLTELLDRLATLYLATKDEGKAVELHQRGIDLREKAPGASPTEAIRALNEGAEWYVRHLRHDGAAAETLWRRLLPIQEKTLGADHTDVADTLMNIARLHAHLSSSGDLSISMKHYPNYHGPRGADNLAKAILVGFDEAEPLLTRALAIRAKRLGAKHERTIEVMQYLASGYSLRKDFARAAPYYRRILVAREKSLGLEHPDLINPLWVIATHAMNEHKYREAIPYWKRLAAIQALARSKKDPVSFFLDKRAEEDDSLDFSAQLRKAERLVAYQEDPAIGPTVEDLAFLKREGWVDDKTDLHALMALTTLDISDNHVDTDGLVHIRRLVNLTTIRLVPEQPDGRSRLDINDAGLPHLRGLTALKSLDLKFTGIRGPGLAALAGFSELRSLCLSFIRIDDAGLAALPVLPGLQTLELNSTQVTDLSLQYLKQFKNLKVLHLFNTQVSKKGVKELKRALPGLTVYAEP